jgi:flagellar motor switch protein FliN/FliY
MNNETSGDEPRSGSIYEVTVEITAILGTSMMPISQILKLGRGAVVELDRRVGENIELRANNQLIARGDIVVLDEMLGVSLTEIVKSSATKITTE